MNAQIEFVTVETIKDAVYLLLDCEISLNEEARNFLENAPEGCICCETKKGNHYYRRRTYTKEDKGEAKVRDVSLDENSYLALLLARKSFYRSVLKFSDANINGIRKALPFLTSSTEERAMASLHPGIRKLLQSDRRKMPDWMAEWMHAPYDKNEGHIEELVITTLSGFNVRSKSEEKIADSLFNANLAFRYEPKLIIGDEVRYPDFVILHPSSTPEHMIYIIWEHAGRMDDMKEYVPGLCRKLQLYSSAGLVIGENMIFTFESRKRPLSTSQVIREKSGIASMIKGSPIVERNDHYEIAGMPVYSRRDDFYKPFSY